MCLRVTPCRGTRPAVGVLSAARRTADPQFPGLNPGREAQTRSTGLAAYEASPFFFCAVPSNWLCKKIFRIPKRRPPNTNRWLHLSNTEQKSALPSALSNQAWAFES